MEKLKLVMSGDTNARAKKTFTYAHTQVSDCVRSK